MAISAMYLNTTCLRQEEGLKLNFIIFSLFSKNGNFFDAYLVQIMIKHIKQQLEVSLGK